MIWENTINKKDLQEGSINMFFMCCIETSRKIQKVQDEVILC